MRREEFDLEPIYIAGCVRTAIGRYGGALKSVPAHTMAAAVIREALDRAGIDGGAVDEVIMGEVRQSTEASNMARCAALEAGLPEQTPAFTINRLCGSSLQAAYCGCMEIWCGMADVLVVGGAENMSRVPMYLRYGRWGDGPMKMVDPNIEAGTTAQPKERYGGDLSMARTAENVAERFHISRAAQDAFAAESQRRADSAIRAGHFRKEILPIKVVQKKKEFVFDTDEFVKPQTTPEILSRLRPIVKPDGTVTAGNACGLNDGASALVLVSGQKARVLGCRPMARIIDMARVALDPSIMGYGPVSATRELLRKTGLTLEQIDLVELNEAFAAQAVACIRDLGLDPQKVNISGGAIALGHPLGCTGTRLIVTLIHNLERTGGRYGIATLCIGGGQSMAVLVERVNREEYRA